MIPISLTDDGITICVSDEQSSNACSPIDVKDCGSVILISSKHLQKTDSLIV